MAVHTRLRRHPSAFVSALLGTLLMGLGMTPSAWAGELPADTLASKGAETRTTVGDPHRFFVTQFRSEFNSTERLGSNGNCGPACVLMAAMAYGRTKPTPSRVSEAMRVVRVASTGRFRPDEATSTQQLANGSRHFGLDARVVTNGSWNALKAHVQAGGMAICCVAPRYIDPSYHSAGHYVLVTGIDANGVRISDPGRALVYGGIRTVPLANFLKAWTTNDSLATFVSPPVTMAQVPSRQPVKS